LAQHARALRDAGLHRLTVSLDTLDPATFRLLSRRDDHARVLEGIDAARAAGFAQLKLDSVVIAGVNDGELGDLLASARGIGAELRFIEYMDVGGATRWRPDAVVSRARMLELLAARFGPIAPVPRRDSAPAEQFTLADGTVFGIISSVTQPFCRSCDRSRLTAAGVWFRCLYATDGTDLRALLRSGGGGPAIAAAIASAWRARDDRGAELRRAQPDRTALAAKAQLQADPHLEM